jgi:hypothetical protein
MKEYIVHVPKHLETNQEEIVSFFGEPIIELIRCKDCKWYEYDTQHRCGCGGCAGYINEDDYCSKAEPKVKK